MLPIAELQVYSQDILRLLQMEDMWKHRKPPHPLVYEIIAAEGVEAAASGSGSAADSLQTGLKAQRTLSLRDSFELFVSR